jgi:hypothetical protein
MGGPLDGPLDGPLESGEISRTKKRKNNNMREIMPPKIGRE